ncbi:ABC transporter ATP-binding protein [Natronoflexus pectinivorans]|uniref:Polar amino acid transport system ATP-binding protein/putative ABC transport system ATP-binding protein n=1 Tax=Natronoflexus pectinivorans TaxID=682526 RepID=A0A4V2RWG1_9BACT|nr:ABC transporter ATP-binding protein [Natronoflexus pectinivorans]TCO08236.1 polar amino acid transport system ATP-binding protein/putative ABC transport system ATP-binding protein [Natronoflexus pectinivorans]
MIQFKDVQLSFNEGIIFNKLSFFINHGQNTCISGPSGSGKSSILKMIQGYLIPPFGEIFVDGILLDKISVRDIRMQMAYVPQNINLPVANGLELMRLIGSEKKRDVVESYIDNLGLEKEMLTRSIDEMSGGQKQRIIIATCLSLEREILLLDEPTSSLDDGSISRLIKVVKNLDKKTIVSASHNPEWIQSMDQEIKIEGI